MSPHINVCSWNFAKVYIIDLYTERFIYPLYKEHGAMINIYKCFVDMGYIIMFVLVGLHYNTPQKFGRVYKVQRYI